MSLEMFADTFANELGSYNSLVVKRLFSLFQTGNCNHFPLELIFPRYSFMMSVVLKGDEMQHLRIAFDIYDIDHDDYLGPHDVFELMRSESDEKLKEDFYKIMDGKFQ